MRVITIYKRLRYSDEGLSFLLCRGYPMGCYLKGLVRLFLLEYPLAEAKKKEFSLVGVPDKDEET